MAYDRSKKVLPLKVAKWKKNLFIIYNLTIHKNFVFQRYFFHNITSTKMWCIALKYFYRLQVYFFYSNFPQTISSSWTLDVTIKKPYTVSTLCCIFIHNFFVRNADWLRKRRNFRSTNTFVLFKTCLSFK